MSEKLIEAKKCRCGEIFSITDKDLEFYEKVSPVIGGVRYGIPSPTLCPECRNQRRLAWRNRRNMYRRACDASGKNIISMFSPDKPYKIYHVKEFEGDKWDPKAYGKDYDFSRSFFEQYDELLRSVPLPHLAVIESSLENADYVNGANSVKNAYLSNNIVEAEDIYYSEDIYNSKMVIDSLSLRNSESCYECVNSIKISDSSHLYECEDCTSCNGCRFCRGCTDCIGCINLVNKRYHIFNKAYSKEEYDDIASKLTRKQIEDGYNELAKRSPFRSAKIIKSENAIGDNIVNSRNIENSYDIYDSENIKNSTFLVGNSKDCHDITFWGQEISLCYEGSAIGINSTKVHFSSETYDNIRDCMYCYFCYPNNSDLFGCVSLRNSSYCILNKQYTKEEYENILPKIIGHMKSTGEWGEFFPAAISPFGYNETVAAEYYPIDQNRAIQSIDKDGTHQFKWSSFENPKPDVSKIIPAGKLPDDINDVPDDILNWAIECAISKKPFRIIKSELEYYRKNDLPIPRLHPDERHKARVAQRNPRKLYPGNCKKCRAEIKTTYGPEKVAIVYCPECYDNAVI